MRYDRSADLETTFWDGKKGAGILEFDFMMLVGKKPIGARKGADAPRLQSFDAAKTEPFPISPPISSAVQTADGTLCSQTYGMLYGRKK